MRLAFFAFLGCACTASSSDVSPPKFDFYYPTGLAISPTADARFLFVLNANSDLRYDAGTLQVLDLDAIDSAAECTPDERIDSQRNCPTTLDGGARASFVIDRSVAKLGNFGSAIAAQPLDDGRIRVFTTVRGDPSITWADFDGQLDCGGSGDFPRCGEDHRLDVLLDDPDFGNLPPEPFVVHADLAGHVFVTHLTSGLVTLVNAPTSGRPPRIHDTIGGLFLANSVGSLRAVGVASRNPTDRDGLVYVTSSSEARVATVHVVPGPLIDGAETTRLASGPSFYYAEAATPGLRSDARGIAFDPTGNRAFLVSREPSELVVVDTSDLPTGAPRNEVIDAIEVCGQASTVVVADFGAGLTAWLPCFATGQLWIVNVDEMRLDAVIDVGRGPNSVVADPLRHRAYVANYAEDTITVIDADPASPTYYAPVVRLGKRRRAE
jgi:hypothetical protein